MEIDESKYCSVKAFAEIQDCFSLRAIYNIHLRSNKNGFEGAFIKVGKRVLVDKKKFWECCENTAKMVRRKK